MVRSTCLLSLLLPGLSLLAGPEGFDPARDVQISCFQGAVILSAPAGAHLKARFLSVSLAPGAPGSLQTGLLPPARDRDEAGDPIYRGLVQIPITGQGLADPVQLEVVYQPCTEGAQGVCYLPTRRRLQAAAGSIPAVATASAAAAVPSGPTVEDLSGRAFALASLQNQVVLVDFWASWCGPCRKSFPALDRLNRTYGPKGLKVVGVSLDEDPQAMARFLEAVPVSFQIARDPARRLAEQYRIVAMPTTLLLDRDGREVARFEGGGRIPAEEKAIAALLAGKALAGSTGATLAAGLRATGGVKAWDRGHLADPIMNLDGDPLSRALWEHIHSSKEGAAGTGGAAGGGCGCN
jgi:thiol-disulfide isomerase/thioredoxin